jgi:RNA polymerase sigma-70 factor (ECF subfamily)
MAKPLYRKRPAPLPSDAVRGGSGRPAAPSVRHLDHAQLDAVEPMLYSFALRAVRRPEVARDLVQETYVAALENDGSFEGRSRLRTWLVGILSRKIVDHYRRSGREVLTDETPEVGLPSRITRERPADLDSRLDQRRASRFVERSLASLSALERTAVLLVDVEQLDRKAAAEAMDVRPTHLRVLLHRGRHKLREALEAADMAGVLSP